MIFFVNCHKLLYIKSEKYGLYSYKIIKESRSNKSKIKS